MVPRHAVILWLAVRGRLNTLDRMNSHGYSRGLCCPLCNRENESLTHLFFACPFASSIWQSLFSKCNLLWTYSCWNEMLLDVANSYKGTSLLCKIVKLMLATSVYLIWRERNSRLFTGKCKDLTVVCMDIILNVRFRINSLSFESTYLNKRLASSWGISEDVFSAWSLCCVLVLCWSCC